MRQKCRWPLWSLLQLTNFNVVSTDYQQTMDIIGPAADDVNVDVPPEEVPALENLMDTALQWIGFTTAAMRERIQQEGFGTFEDLLISLNEKDIRDMNESYGRCTIADGRFIFGTRRIKY
ncbi:hypothetical protein MHU86_12123 [Fragilaria crotonensis]|nr:hypothetical protein MHU86_12123 [Fragilaria crotonensis]